MNPLAYYRDVVLPNLARFQLLCHNCNYLKRIEMGEHNTRARRLKLVVG